MIVEPRTKRERRRSFPMRFVEKFSVQKFLRACIISSTASAGEMPLREKFSSAPLEPLRYLRRATRPAYPVPNSCAQPSASTTARSDAGARMAAAVPTSQGSP
jgi:hypothetical protein